MKFYQSRKFKKLSKEWTEILKKTGFDDIEDDRGNLKNHDLRTTGFHSRDIIADFFTSIGTYLSETRGIPKRDRRVLERYAKGEWITHISKEMRIGYSTVRKIIATHKPRILGRE